MKKTFWLLPLFLAGLVMPGCGPEASASSAPSSATSESQDLVSSDSPPKTEVETFPVPEGVPAYREAALSANGIPIPLYAVETNMSQIWNGLAPDRVAAGAAIILMSGEAIFTYRALTYDLSEFHEYTRIRPLGRGIEPSFDLAADSFSFRISQPGAYAIEPCGDRRRTIHLFIDDLAAKRSFDETDPLYFGPGLHDKENDPRLAGGSTIRLTSNQTVFLDYGAVVRGRFEAYGQNDVSIIGGGIIDGSVFPRIAGQASGNVAFVPLDFQKCSSLRFEGFAVFDPAGWAVNWYFDEDSSISGLRIITSRSNGDGISIQSCRDINVTGCFVRTWDDSLVVKNYPDWANPYQKGATSAIHFDHCLLWTDLAQSMEIGYETVGEEMEDISFSDITVLHAYHKPVISIHDGNDAAIKNVRYSHITVEAAFMGGGDAGANDQLIQFAVAYSPTWSDQYGSTPLGSITDVTVENVKVVDGNAKEPISIAGCRDERPSYEGSEHFVANVALKDISIKGQTINADYPYLSANEYVTGLTVTSSGGPIEGASLA